MTGSLIGHPVRYDSALYLVITYDSFDSSDSCKNEMLKWPYKPIINTFQMGCIPHPRGIYIYVYHHCNNLQKWKLQVKLLSHTFHQFSIKMYSTQFY